MVVMAKLAGCEIPGRAGQRCAKPAAAAAVRAAAGPGPEEAQREEVAVIR